MLSPHRELKHIPDYNATVGLADYPSEDLEEDVTAAFYKSSTGSGISNEKLHQDDQIYEDPGCHKEALYSWFEKRKIRKIRIRDIRCTAVSAHNVLLHTCYSHYTHRVSFICNSCNSNYMTSLCHRYRASVMGLETYRMRLLLTLKILSSNSVWCVHKDSSCAPIFQSEKISIYIYFYSKKVLSCLLNGVLNLNQRVKVSNAISH